MSLLLCEIIALINYNTKHLNKSHDMSFYYIDSNVKKEVIVTRNQFKHKDAAPTIKTIRANDSKVDIKKSPFLRYPL